jgi:tetratricopeptide (TPR) repeat protein
MIKCNSCKREVAEHLKSKSIFFCFYCQSDKVGLGRILEPQSHVRTMIEKCAVCGETPSPESRAFCLCDRCLKFIELATGRTSVQLEQNLNRPWLIKSAGRVWGPMSSEEVERGLRAKEIGAFDEIIKPLQHWKYLREEDEFSGLLEELKMNAHAREDTLSITVIENTANDVAEAIRDVRPIAVDGAPTNFDYSRMGPPSPSYQKPWLLAVVSGLIVVVGIIWAANHWNSKRVLPQTDAQIDAVVREVLFSKTPVDRDRALGILSDSFERHPDNPRLALNLALIHLEQRETVPANRILQGLLSKKLPQTHDLEVRNALALGYIMNGQVEKATDELETVHKRDPENYTAAMNLGAVYYLSDDYEKSREFLLKALEIRKMSGEALTLFAETALKDLESRHSKTMANEAFRRITDFIPDALDRKQEATILAASLALKLENTDKASELMEDFLRIDPDLSQDHLHDLMIFKEHLYWEHLLSRCRDLSAQLPSTPRLAAALGLCHLKANEPLVGREVIEDSLKRAPDDQLVQATYGYVQALIGQKDQALASLKRATAGSPTLSVALILKGRLCQSNEDFECAEANWKQLSEKHPDFPQVKVGLAEVAWSRKNRAEAEKRLREAERISPQYIPLLRLKENIVLKKGRL